jgi:fibronectin-binding autotransporter adhesin
MRPPTRSGLSKSGNYTFASWNTAADGSGTNYSAGNTFTIAAPLTLYAQWNSTAIYTWTQTAGNPQPWVTGSNWSGGVAPSPSVGNTMDFSKVDLAASTTLTLGADRKASTWTFGDTSGTQTWSVASSNKIILAGTTPTISVLQNSVTVNCPITGSTSLTKTGAGNLTLSSTNTYTGDTFIKEGSLSLGSGSNRIPTNSVVTLGDTSTKATLILGSGGSPRNQTIGGLSSTGLGGNVIGQGSGSALSVNISGKSTFAGVLGGTGANNNNLALIKQGSGTLTLSGTNTYTGTTWLNGGTLVVSGSLANTTVTVANGTTLAGSGSIGGNVTIQNGGHQAFVVATTSLAQVTRTISGTLTLDAGHVIDLSSAATSAAGTYTLVTATGGVTGTVGTVNLTGLNGTVSIVGKSLVLNVTAASDYDVWKSSNGLIGGPNDDDDQDGMINFGEYAFGLNPNSAASVSPVSGLINTAAGASFNYTRRKPSLTIVTCIHEYSTTLASGSWSPFTPDSVTTNGGDPIEEITVKVPAALLTNPKLFLRVRATQ